MEKTGKDMQSRCSNCNTYLVRCCINPSCAMHYERKSKEKNIAKFLFNLGSGTACSDLGEK